MTLVDTSVWADHIKKPVAELVKALEAEDEVLMHPFVFGELFLGQALLVPEPFDVSADQSAHIMRRRSADYIL